MVNVIIWFYSRLNHTIHFDEFQLKHVVFHDKTNCKSKAHENSRAVLWHRKIL